MNTRRQDDDYRNKFDAFGLSERFEFVRRDWESDHGRKVEIRCKTCGKDFSTWSLSQIIKGRQRRLICPYCGKSSDGKDLWTLSQQADKVADYYVQGHSVADTAARFGISTYQVNNLAKLRHITNGIGFRDARKIQQKNDAEQNLINRLSGIGFDYVGGYSDQSSKVLIRCCKCGADFKRSVTFLRTGNVICPECQKREAVEREEERKRIAEQNAEVRRLELEWHRLTHPSKDHYLEQHEAFLNREGICEICGKPYTVREYVESCGLKKAQDNGVCSDKCRRKKLNQSVRDSRKRRGVKDSHRARARKYGCAYDSSVTLPKLIKRDGLRCAICGEMCDPNDHSWTKYMGAKSPTIDHIIPMAKGGGHTWDNVQVAHAICNSYKCDNLSEVG